MGDAADVADPSEKRQPGFAFRLCCLLGAGDFEKKDVTEIVVAGDLRVDLHPQAVIGEQKWLIFLSHGFSTEAEARAAGEKVKAAVMLAALVLGAGIDVGRDREISSAPLVAGERDERAQPFVHGLHVFRETRGIIFGFLHAGRPVHMIQSDALSRAVVQAYGRFPTAKQTLAAQLYIQSHFESSDAARFLTLVSAVEVLADQKRKSDAALAVLDGMIDAVRTAGLDSEETDALCNGIGMLKRESINAACRALARRHLGEEAAVVFKNIYEVRSVLTHDGEPPPRTDMAAQVRALDALVRRLILADVTAGGPQ